MLQKPALAWAKKNKINYLLFCLLWSQPTPELPVWSPVSSGILANGCSSVGRLSWSSQVCRSCYTVCFSPSIPWGTFILSASLPHVPYQAFSLAAQRCCTSSPQTFLWAATVAHLPAWDSFFKGLGTSRGCLSNSNDNRPAKKFICCCIRVRIWHSQWAEFR